MKGSDNPIGPEEATLAALQGENDLGSSAWQSFFLTHRDAFTEEALQLFPNLSDSDLKWVLEDMQPYFFERARSLETFKSRRFLVMQSLELAVVNRLIKRNDVHDALWDDFFQHTIEMSESICRQRFSPLDEADRQDLNQKVREQFFRQAMRIRNDPHGPGRFTKSVEAMVTRIMICRIRDMAKSRKRKAKLFGPTVEEIQTRAGADAAPDVVIRETPARALEEKERLEMLRLILETVGPACRMLLTLKIGDGIPLTEISQQLEMSYDKARTRLANCLKAAHTARESIVR